jgi:hypothetical protein
MQVTKEQAQALLSVKAKTGVGGRGLQMHT